MTVSITIDTAIYGGSDELCQARDITQALQKKINNGYTSITFDNATFGDTTLGVEKGFAVVATIDDIQYAYAGKEGDTIDFGVLPINGDGADNIRIVEIEAPFNAFSDTLFTGCSITLENLGSEFFPNENYPSSWLWVDFYLVELIEPLQEFENFLQIGELPVSINNQISHKERQSFYMTGYEHVDMAKYLLKTPRFVDPGEYYLYAQVRNSSSSINTSNGCFSDHSIIYTV